MKEWAKNNPNWRKEYDKKNRTKINLRQRLWRKNNPKYDKQWCKKNWAKVKTRQRRCMQAQNDLSRQFDCLSKSRWSDTDNAFLITSKMGNTELAKCLGRSVYAVVLQKNRLRKIDKKA